tara:strand:- start:6765 stop:7184 length:420 start_codon:yes stop_codon:yes gene_type:complete
MRDSIQLEGHGTVWLTPPRSLVTVNDIVSEWSGSQGQRAKLARLSAAVVGVCWGVGNQGRCPVYDVNTAEVLAYGGAVLEWLLGRGVVLSSLYTEAQPLFVELWDLMPKAKEVEAATATFPKGGEAGSPSDEDRQGVEP